MIPELLDDSLPFMPVCVRDFASSDAEASMTNEQFGAYWRLLLRSWMRQPACTLPNDDTVLAGYARMSRARWRAVGGPVKAKFASIGSGLVRNERQWLAYQDAMTRLTANTAKTQAAVAARYGPRHDLRNVDRNGDRNGDDDGDRNGLPIKKKKKDLSFPKNGNERVETLIDVWCRLWGERYPTDSYVVGPHGGKYGANLKRLEKALGREELEQRMRRYLAATELFYVDIRHDLGTFISQINRFGPRGGRSLGAAPSPDRLADQHQRDQAQADRETALEALIDNLPPAELKALTDEAIEEIRRRAPSYAPDQPSIRRAMVMILGQRYRGQAVPTTVGVV